MSGNRALSLAATTGLVAVGCICGLAAGGRGAAAQADDSVVITSSELTVIEMPNRPTRFVSSAWISRPDGTIRHCISSARVETFNTNGELKFVDQAIDCSEEYDP